MATNEPAPQAEYAPSMVMGSVTLHLHIAWHLLPLLVLDVVFGLHLHVRWVFSAFTRQLVVTVFSAQTAT